MNHKKYIIYCRMYSTHISEQIPWKMYVSRVSMNQTLRILPQKQLVLHFYKGAAAFMARH